MDPRAAGPGAAHSLASGGHAWRGGHPVQPRLTGHPAPTGRPRPGQRRRGDPRPGCATSPPRKTPAWDCGCRSPRTCSSRASTCCSSTASRSRATPPAQELSELLDAHYYTDGFGYVPPGTPTTNTGAAGSGLDRRSAAYIAVHQVPGTDQAAQDDRSAAGVLAALGVTLTENPSPPALSLEWQPHIVAAAQALSQTSGGTPEQHWAQAQAAVLGGVEDAAGLAPQAALEEERIAEAMNRAQWPGPGYLPVPAAGGQRRRGLEAPRPRQRHRRRRLPALPRPPAATRRGADERHRHGNRHHRPRPGRRRRVPGRLECRGGRPRAQRVRPRRRRGRSTRRGGHRDRHRPVAAAAATRERHSDADGDWAGAARNLTVNRAARYAYYRWLARSPGSRNPSRTLRLRTGFASETAALYGTAAFDAARDHFVSYVRPGGALPAITAGNQPYGVLIACALDTWHPPAASSACAPSCKRCSPCGTPWNTGDEPGAAARARPGQRRHHRPGDPAAAARHEPGQPAGFRARARRPRLCPQPVALRPDAAKCRLGHRNGGKQRPAAARHRDRLDAAAGRADRRRGIRAADRRPGRHGRPRVQAMASPG